MKVSPLHNEFGAVIEGCDLSRSLSDAEFAEIDLAINQHSFLLFRNQNLDDDLHIQFTERFGDLEEEHVAYYSRGEVNYIGYVGNVDANGVKHPNADRRVNSQRGNEMWHSDSSFREVPSIYSLLYAYEVPDEEGDTEFASARAAYNRLSTAEKQQLEDLIGIHDYIYSRTKISEDAVNEGQRTFMYPVRQKLVRKNPVTNEKNFYVGSHVRDIVGMETEAARELIANLINQATRPESVYRHHWQAGDFVIWDNRCILHRGCGYDADRYRRRMHQTRVRGVMPTLAE